MMKGSLRSPATTDELSNSLVGHLIATAAHRLRNPLAAMSSKLQVLLRRLDADDPHRQALEVLEKEMDKLGDVINGIVDFCPLMKPARDSCDLVAMLESTLAMYHPDLEASEVQIKTDYAINPCPIIISADELQQILPYLLRFLVSTAAKSTTLYFTIQKSSEEWECRMAQTMGLATQQVSSHDDTAFFEQSGIPGAAFGVDLCHAILRTYRHRLCCQKDAEGRWIFSIFIHQDGVL